jgi:ureidoacrylate peracid hydrolase
VIEPKACAILIIDMQNAFIAPGAAFETPGAREMIPRLIELVDFARKSQILIIWTQSDHSPPYGGNMLKKFPVIAKDRILWPGDISFKFYPNMPQPHESELEHIIVKHKYDAFFETPLDAILRFRKINTVIITGTATNACCESTARSAFMRDYDVVFLSDLTATFDSAMHQATLRNIDLLFGRVTSTSELFRELSSHAAHS